MQRSDFTVKLETDKDQISQILHEEKLRRREMWRVSKFRSRKKRENYVNTLNNENRQLHDQIKRLEQLHHPVPRTNPAKENAWSVVVEYFQMFRFGLSKMLVKSPPSSPTKMKQSAQMDFLLASMKSDVLFNCDRGTDAIMKNWGFISSCFESVEMVLDGLAKNAFGSIVATTTTTVIFSEHTVDTLFPHLRRTDGNMREMMSTLGEKFVNEKIVMRGSTHFEWDSGYCRIARIQHQSDMITPVLHVLGTLENVSRVFDKALITPDFRCRQNQTRNI
ncbi:Bzip transcription factor [Phytophthora megakarya]|uniref:Bzip transcription factor n=1 Tax=Phytophthora megakarya TaxID=4795 RepID=A0A225W7K2_9STRA|nr:Bzip transcription factor [Phytophthora megakarya]